MSGKKVVHVPGLKAIGPYSQAVRVGGLLFVSGQPGEAAGTSFETQVRQAFQNLDTVLKAGGSQLKLVVNTTVLVSDMSNFPEVQQTVCRILP